MNNLRWLPGKNRTKRPEVPQEARERNKQFRELEILWDLRQDKLVSCTAAKAALGDRRRWMDAHPDQVAQKHHDQLAELEQLHESYIESADRQADGIRAHITRYPYLIDMAGVYLKPGLKRLIEE